MKICYVYHEVFDNDEDDDNDNEYDGKWKLVTNKYKNKSISSLFKYNKCKNINISIK